MFLFWTFVSMRYWYIVKEWHLILHDLCLYLFPFHFPCIIVVSFVWFVGLFRSAVVLCTLIKRETICLLLLISVWDYLCDLKMQRSETAVIVGLQRVCVSWKGRTSKNCQRGAYTGVPRCPSLHLYHTQVLIPTEFCPQLHMHRANKLCSILSKWH